MKKALVIIPYLDEDKEKLINAANGRCEFTFLDKRKNREEYISALKNTNLIIGEPGNDDFQYCKKLEMLQSSSSGVNYYVDGGKFPKGAKLCCMTGVYGNVIAEHLLGMLLSITRRIPEYRDRQNEQKWGIIRYDKPLEGSTVLILGAGDIGTTLAKWLRPMVGKIMGIRRTKRDFPDCFDEMATLDKLDEMLPKADFVICVLPHTPATTGLFDERRLRLMKEDAVLINGGRGSLIDQEALIKVMAEGKFFGVGLDVTSPEPLPAESPLWKQERLLITSHAAGNSCALESPLERKIRAFVLQNTMRWLEGEEPENVIDFSIGYKNNL
ncbi:MAG: D-2-hydroxyacid dehydrogenase [Oscillospiraceae bacterium]|nr:D-2-hydroxyacid dehydrogenase [Oscillospiraceae bacterium]